MEKFKEKIEELSQDYDIPEEHISSYLNTLLEYPFIAAGAEESLLYCLELVVAERYTQKLLSETGKRDLLYRSLNETFSDMILRVYGDEAIYYLNRDFLSNRNIRIEDSYKDNDEIYEMGEEEREYQGFKF